MYKSHYLAILPLLAFALVAFASEYRGDSFPDSITENLPDSPYDEALTANNHIRDAVSTDPHDLLAGLLRSLQSSPTATPTMDPSATDQVDGFDRHKHKKHRHHKCNDDDDEDDNNDKKKPGCGCKKCPVPTYHISLNCEDEKYKTISLPAQGRPFDLLVGFMEPVLSGSFAVIRATIAITIWNLATHSRLHAHRVRHVLLPAVALLLLVVAHHLADVLLPLVDAHHLADVLLPVAAHHPVAAHRLHATAAHHLRLFTISRVTSTTIKSTIAIDTKSYFNLIQF
ncbi:hypothetical protein BX667DRAFT_507703 [Coemansia mojavensis]|nr:hypothetical protein BX667DRAFT_507703 [Coemansia mojavensis]